MVLKINRELLLVYIVQIMLLVIQIPLIFPYSKGDKIYFFLSIIELIFISCVSLYNIIKKNDLLIEMILITINACFILYYENLNFYSVCWMIMVSCFQTFFLGIYFVSIIRSRKLGKIKNFIIHLVIDSIAVIFCFATIYSSLYNQYFHDGYDILNIDRGMNFSECLLENDFIFYSADCFLGFDKSDVDIRYIDVSSLNEVQKKHIESIDGADLAIFCVKIFSYCEKIIYVFFLTVILTYITDNKRKEKGKYYEVYITEKKDSVETSKEATPDNEIVKNQDNQLTEKEKNWKIYSYNVGLLGLCLLPLVFAYDILDFFFPLQEKTFGIITGLIACVIVLIVFRKRDSIKVKKEKEMEKILTEAALLSSLLLVFEKTILIYGKELLSEISVSMEVLMDTMMIILLTIISLLFGYLVFVLFKRINTLKKNKYD